MGTEAKERVLGDVVVVQVRDWARLRDVFRLCVRILGEHERIRSMLFEAQVDEEGDKGNVFLGDEKSDLLWTMRAKNAELPNTRSAMPRLLTDLARDGTLWCACFVTREKRKDGGCELIRALGDAVGRKEAQLARLAHTAEPMSAKRRDLVDAVRGILRDVVVRRKMSMNRPASTLYLAERLEQIGKCPCITTLPRRSSSATDSGLKRRRAVDVAPLEHKRRRLPD